MKKYPNASSKVELEILKAIDSDGYNKNAFREVLGKMMIPDESAENKVKLGRVRENYAKGDIEPEAYLISLENNNSTKTPEFENHLSSLRKMIKDPSENNIAEYAECDVKMMRKSPDKNVPNEDIATAISHHLLKYKKEEDISFENTYHNLHGIYKNASHYLEPDKHNYVREVFENNPDKATQETNSPVRIAYKEEKEHPMMPKIWKALEIGREYQSNLVSSPLFKNFPDNVKEKQAKHLANISNSSILIFGQDDFINKDLMKAYNVNNELLKSNKNKKGTSLSI